MKKLSIDIMYELADRRGLQFLSSDYQGTNIKHKWKCGKCQYIWKAVPSSIQRNSGCPKCAGRCQSLETMHKLAKKRGFQFLSSCYKTMNTKYEWKCRDNHVWKASAHHIKGGTGCPYCNNKYVQEEKCRFVLEKLTQKKFIKDRSTIGNRLELDGYCEELGLAFEYHGKQHFKNIPYWHKNGSDLSSQKKRDTNKLSRCKKLDIDLMIVRWDCDDIEIFLRSELKNRSLPSEGLVDWNEFRDNPSRLQEVQNAAKTINAKCLSKKYMTAISPMSFECITCDRQWQSTANDIKNGYGCLACGGKMKKDISEVRDRGQLLGLDLISSEYINARTKIEWQCNKCSHVFMRTPSDIQQGKSCPKCAIRNGWKTRRCNQLERN